MLSFWLSIPQISVATFTQTHPIPTKQLSRGEERLMYLKENHFRADIQNSTFEKDRQHLLTIE